MRYWWPATAMLHLVLQWDFLSILQMCGQNGDKVSRGIQKESQGCQVSTLLYCLGEEAEGWQVFQMRSHVWCFLSLQKKCYFEHTKFNCRCQLLESAEQFIASLYNLVVDFQYEDLKNEMIWDRIVVSISGSALSELLQTDPELTLEYIRKNHSPSERSCSWPATGPDLSQEGW